MRRKLLMLLALVVVLSLVIAVPVGAKKPAPKLEGTMVPLDLKVPVAEDPIQEPPPPPLCTADGVSDPELCLCINEEESFRGLYSWRGTITFPELGPYTIVFINLGTAKENPSGVASPFEEIWAIYELDEVVIDADDGCPLVEAATIWGYDSGVSNLNNNTYRMNGDVESAIGDFEDWEGRKVHMSGTFTLDDFPLLHAPGTLRLN